ncbi:MAG: sulfatase-like hydrolase/transferase [Planctomycetaceae bacterium]|nr:sulfatase-like hydrolase/transferase [Planctomycetaceae bacterium]
MSPCDFQQPAPDRSDVVRFFPCVLMIMCLQSVVTANDARISRPNIVLILVDDLGKEWVSCYGAEDIQTPRVDQLAAEGMQFDNFYVMPQCTPTRLTLLTGQYPFRHGWVNHWDVPRWGGGCHYDWKRNPCMATVMKKAGYSTAIAGKWQINDFRVQPNAMTEMGFDEYCMWTGGEGRNPPSQERYWNPYIHTTDGSRTYDGEFGPDVYAGFLLDFIRRKKDEPFFVCFPMALTHGPLVTTPDEPDVTGDLAKHKAMVRYTDQILGRFVDTLNELQIREKTIIIWTTDNGTAGGITGHRNGRAVAGQKSNSVEPGVCMPMIVSAPGLVPQGIRTDALADLTDLLPTFAELAGTQPQSGFVYDGTSFAQLLTGRAQDSGRSWIMAMGGKNEARLTDKGVENRYVFRDRVLREKRFKLFVDTQRRPSALYDMIADPTESSNLIGSSDLQAQAALQRLFALVDQFPGRDNDPIYTPLPPQPWDVKISAQSQVWKE